MDKLLRTRLATVVVLLAVFGSGLLVGLAADRSLVATPAAEAAVAAEPEAPAERRVPMYERVGPDAAQKMVIDSIVSEYRVSMKSLHAEFRAAYNPRYQALVDETRAAIKGVLTPEQAIAYDSLIAERERKRAERDSTDDRE